MAPSEAAVLQGAEEFIHHLEKAHCHKVAAGLSTEEFVWLIGSVADFHQIPFDAKLLKQRFAAPYTGPVVAKALQAFGVDTVHCSARELGEIAPRLGKDCVAFGLLATQSHDERRQLALVVGASNDDVVVFRALSEKPVVLPRTEIQHAVDWPLTVANRALADPIDPDSAGPRYHFGFGWFTPEILKHKRIWRDVLFASAAIQLLALGMPLMTQAIIDKVVVHRTESTLIALGTGLAFFMVFSSAFTWIRQRLILHTGMRIDGVLSVAVFRHLVELPLRYFHIRPTGVIAARLHGVEVIRDFLASTAIALVLDLPFLTICLAIMFSYSVTLTFIAVGILALIVTVSLLVAPIFQAKLNREFLLGARNQGFLTEYVAGMDTVKSLQMEPILQSRFGDFQAAYLQAGFETRQVANTYNVVAITLEQATSLLILAVGAYIVMAPPTTSSQVFTVGMLVAFQMFASKLGQPVMRLVGIWQQFQQARLAVDRLGDVMNAPSEPYSIVPGRSQNVRESSEPVIDVRHLAFRYEDDLPFLYEDLNLAIHDGECVAIMGPSGSGKSTLAKLLQGFFQPTRGKILIDGIDSRYLSANELRAAFGVVPQETVLFSGTILDNLLLACPNASFDEIVAACRMAEIHEVIEQLPKGYKTEIGERGAGLSGGQRQRIAIARALLKKPKVLIFDEATSNLDQATAESFARTIDHLRGDVAVLFITHAPIGTLKFDRIIEIGESP